jgi:uncharacterized membrane protein HdeD (DUF308 family)
LIADLARNWWLMAIRGVAAILFAILAFIWPGLTVTVLVLFFGAYALVDGIFAILAAIAAARERLRWWPFVVEGVLGIVAGVVTFVWPGVTALVLLYLIAAWAVVTGVFEIVAAIQLRKVIQGELLMILAGLLSIVFGLLLFFYPSAGALAVIWLIAAYALVFGVVMLIFAFRLRGLRSQAGGAPGAPAPAAV